MNGPLETADMLVVTTRVPTRDPAEVSVTVRKGLIHVLGPDGFRHEMPLPAGADAERLHAELFHDILELRAPRATVASVPKPRTVSVGASTI
jgi:HSP20 family molecular chaperone IbpA